MIDPTIETYDRTLRYKVTIETFPTGNSLAITSLVLSLPPFLPPPLHPSTTTSTLTPASHPPPKSNQPRESGQIMDAYFQVILCYHHNLIFTATKILYRFRVSVFSRFYLIILGIINIYPQK